MKKMKIATAALIVAGVVTAPLLAATSAQAYTYNLNYGYADCSSSTWPTTTSTGTGSIYMEIGDPIFAVFNTYNNGSVSKTVTLNSSSLTEHYMTYADIDYNNTPNTHSWACRA